MAITFNQGNGTSGGLLESSRSAGWSGGPTDSGKLIVVCIATYKSGSNPTHAVADDVGNTYTLLAQITTVSGSDNYRLSIFYAKDTIAAGAGTNVTVTPSATAFITFSIANYSGADTTTPNDQSGTAGPTAGTAVSSGNITPTANNELLAAAVTHLNGDIAMTTEAGWTLNFEVTDGTSVQPISNEYKVQGTAAAEDADWTLGASTTWLAVIGSFKAAGAAALPKNPFLHRQAVRRASTY